MRQGEYFVGEFIMPYTWVIPLFRDENGVYNVAVPFCFGIN
mgnify:CR=1 FL=1